MVAYDSQFIYWIVVQGTFPENISWMEMHDEVIKISNVV